jgi:hypothetical protein
LDDLAAAVQVAGFPFQLFFLSQIKINFYNLVQMLLHACTENRNDAWLMRMVIIFYNRVIFMETNWCLAGGNLPIQFRFNQKM